MQGLLPEMGFDFYENPQMAASEVLSAQHRRHHPYFQAAGKKLQEKIRSNPSPFHSGKTA